MWLWPCWGQGCVTGIRAQACPAALSQHCHLPQLKGTAAPPPAQGASSLSGHPAATRKNHFWGLSELLQCPCAKSVLPSSRFSAWRDQHSPADRGGKGSVHSFFVFCVLPLAPGLSSPSPRRGAHHLTVMFTAWLYHLPSFQKRIYLLFPVQKEPPSNPACFSGRGWDTILKKRGFE